MSNDDVDRLISQFFEIFNNKDLKNKDWTVAYRLCLPEAIIVKKNGLDQAVYNLDSFLKTRIEILTNGALSDFEEYEISARTILKREYWPAPK